MRIKILITVLLLQSVGFSCCLIQAEEPSLKVMTYNVWYGFTQAPERKADWLKWMAEQSPDVVALQELNQYTPKKLAADAITWGHPYSVLLKKDGFPTGITSRYPITDVEKQVAGFHHGLICCQIQGIHFFVVHLHPSDWEIRHREIDLLLQKIQTLRKQKPIIVAGDFNTFSPSDRKQYEAEQDMIPFFQRLDARDQGKNLRNGQIDYTHLEQLEKSGLIDLIARKRTHFQGTFPALQRAGEDLGPSRRLDYLFVTTELAERCRHAEIIDTQRVGQFSDHYPVIGQW